MEAGTVLLGVISHALGITFVTLTACILLYLIIWVFLNIGSILYRKIIRCRKIKAILDAFEKSNPNIECRWTKKHWWSRRKKRIRVHMDVGMNMICQNRRTNGMLSPTKKDTEDFVKRVGDDCEAILGKRAKTAEEWKEARWGKYYTAPPTSQKELNDLIEKLRRAHDETKFTAPSRSLQDECGCFFYNGKPILYKDRFTSLEDLMKELEL